CLKLFHFVLCSMFEVENGHCQFFFSRFCYLFFGNPNYYNRETQPKKLESVVLWFLGQGFHDHLEKHEAEIPEENKALWMKLNYQLCAILNLKVIQDLLSFWTNARDVFANDVQRLFDSTQKIISLQHTNHDMVSHTAKAKTAAEKDHVCDQILSSEQIPSMSSLITRLLLVPTRTKGDGIAVENSAMVASRGRGRSSHDTRGMLRNGRGGRGKLICLHCGKESHLQNRCYDLVGWPGKTANISSSDISSNGRTSSQLISEEEYQEFLRLKSNNHTQSSTSPSVSTACISHFMGSQGPWIVDLGASDHIYGNDFVFSFISSPKFPHFILLANGSKMLSQGVGQVSLSSSIITFYVDSFVIRPADWLRT
ncbi:hypothetical protein CR513_47562, partial [Mucuna pruriens]